MKFLNKNLVKIGASVENADDAIKEAGSLLLKEDLIEESYIDAMVKAYRDNGPYFVLAPHIAIPHARPEDGVKEASVSFVKLASPVQFGHATNDPVQLVFGLGASNSEEHLTLLRKLTALLSNHKNVEQLINAKGFNDLQNIL